MPTTLAVIPRVIGLPVRTLAAMRAGLVAIEKSMQPQIDTRSRTYDARRASPGGRAQFSDSTGRIGIAIEQRLQPRGRSSKLRRALASSLKISNAVWSFATLNRRWPRALSRTILMSPPLSRTVFNLAAIMPTPELSM